MLWCAMAARWWIDCRREWVDEQKAQGVMRELVDNGQLTDPDSARGKLLQTAAHLFRNKGFERTTVRDLSLIHI